MSRPNRLLNSVLTVENVSAMKNKSKHLILGATGFLGRNLYEYLKINGYDVSRSSRDLTDFEDTKDLVYGFDYVWMMAAKTFGLGVLTNRPDKLVRDNVVMNANVLQACYEEGVKKVLMVSSSVVYHDEHKCFKEEDLDLNKQPYHLYHGVGWVKRYTEQLARFYDGLGMKVITVRPTGMYGRYDKYDSTKSHIIPAIIHKCLTNETELEVWGTGTNVKDFIYVDDFTEDIVSLFDKYDSCEPLNICSGKLYSIKEIVDLIVELSGFTGNVRYNIEKPETIAIKSISNEKINKIVGRTNYTCLRYGLQQTIDWIKNDIASKR